MRLKNCSNNIFDSNKKAFSQNNCRLLYNYKKNIWFDYTPCNRKNCISINRMNYIHKKEKGKLDLYIDEASLNKNEINRIRTMGA